MATYITTMVFWQDWSPQTDSKSKRQKPCGAITPKQAASLIDYKNKLVEQAPPNTDIKSKDKNSHDVVEHVPPQRTASLSD